MCRKKKAPSKRSNKIDLDYNLGHGVFWQIVTCVKYIEGDEKGGKSRDHTSSPTHMVVNSTDTRTRTNTATVSVGHSQ